MNPSNLLLIDGFNLLSRAYFATSYGRTDDQLKNSKGIYTNAVRVYLQKLFNLIHEHSITHLAIAWDVKREETQRRMEHDFYKATRTALPEPLIVQYELCRSLLDQIGVQQISIAPYEADDVLGTLSRSHPYQHCFIYSNDRDLLQLLSPVTSQIIAGKKGEYIYSLQDFELEYGITSAQWIDVKALLGDSSDNIPGCPGIGEKSALPLIRHYGSLEQIYDTIEELDPVFQRNKKKLVAGKETAFLSKKLSAIQCEIMELCDFNYEDLRLQISFDLLRDHLEELELRIKLPLLDSAG